MFSNACAKASEVVSYLNMKAGDSLVTSFVVSKFKVAPLIQQTIPQLDLHGAVSNLTKFVCDEME